MKQLPNLGNTAGETTTEIFRDESSSTRKKDRLIRWFALVVFLVSVVVYGWNSDDAYHGYIMAKHLAEGKGFVYNVGYRTTASTCPLLTLIQTLVFLFTDNPDICGLFLGLLFSGLAAWILLFRFCPSPAAAACMLGLMVSSHCFMTYTTSGLENSLLFFFGACFLDIYFRHSILRVKHLFFLSLLMSLLAMTRPDSVLVFIPMVVWAYLTKDAPSFPRRFVIGLTGLLPFFAWTMFSVLYFGFPFPNTFYAKLHTGISHLVYVEHGLWYHVSSWLVDPTLLLVPLLFLLIVFKSRAQKWLPLLLGMVLYDLYLLTIGGDFMAGRHFTQLFFLSASGIAMLLAEKGSYPAQDDSLHHSFETHTRVLLVAIIAIGFLWRGFVLPIVTEHIVNLEVAKTTKRSAVDERAYYIERDSRCATLQAIPAFFRNEDPREVLYHRTLPIVVSAHEQGAKGYCAERFLMWGSLVWRCHDFNMFLTDIYALSDPLLARLEVDKSRIWRIGHAARDIPLGYRESLAAGENKIENKALHEYYDKLLLVMTGKLFDRRRLKTILDLNLGRYEYLLQEYERDRKRASDDLTRACSALHDSRNAEDTLLFLDSSLSRNASYVLRDLAHFYRGCLYQDLDNNEERAEKEFRLALSGTWCGRLAPCADRLARIEEERGHLDEAISLWEEAARLDPENLSMLKNLSLAYRGSGNVKKYHELEKKIRERFP